MVNVFCKATVLVLILAGACLAAQPSEGSAQQSAKLDARVTVQMDYLLYLPGDYEKQDAWPLLLFAVAGAVLRRFEP